MTDEAVAVPEGWTKPPPLTEGQPPEGGMLTMATAGTADEPSVEIALRWSQLYSHDVEYEGFFDWIGRRSNPERTDFHEILESLPIQFGPEALPPPLRRYFLKKFGR